MLASVPPQQQPVPLGQSLLHGSTVQQLFDVFESLLNRLNDPEPLSTVVAGSDVPCSDRVES